MSTTTAVKRGKGRAGQTDSPERVERRKATQAANANMEIDFGAGLDPAEFTNTRRGMWVRKLETLIDGVTAGKGEYNKFYRLGWSPTVTWARTTISNLNKAELYAKEVALQSRYEDENGQPDSTAGSAVYGCVVFDGNGGSGAEDEYSDEYIVTDEETE